MTIDGREFLVQAFMLRHNMPEKKAVEEADALLGVASLAGLSLVRSEDAIEAACKPWENCVGDAPDWESPLHDVWQAALVWSADLLAKRLGVKDYTPGDGSESIEGDYLCTLLNILAEAGMWDKDEGRPAALAKTEREVMGCSQCGGTGYRPAVQYGIGHGTGTGSIVWADHAVKEPCSCTRFNWSPVAPHWPQPIIVPLKDPTP